MNQRFQYSLENDPNMMLTVSLVDVLILKVILLKINAMLRFININNNLRIQPTFHGPISPFVVSLDIQLMGIEYRLNKVVVY